MSNDDWYNGYITRGLVDAPGDLIRDLNDADKDNYIHRLENRVNELNADLNAANNRADREYVLVEAYLRMIVTLEAKLRVLTGLDNVYGDDEGNADRFQNGKLSISNNPRTARAFAIALEEALKEWNLDTLPNKVPSGETDKNT